MFSYQVLTEEEAMNERFSLLKEGEYDAVVKTSIDAISSNSGNPMMDMTISVFDENGKEHAVRDFLVFTKAMMWKVVHFADSAGLIKEYESGRLCSDIAINTRVRVKVNIEPGNEIPEGKLKGKPLGSKYPDKNKIEDYVKKTEQNPLANNDPFDDDIPNF